MHRSGTSAVTALITLLGLRGPTGEDTLPLRQWNERGNNESAALTRFNQQILLSMGGDWSAPPVFGPHWQKAPEMVERRARASALLARSFAVQPFVWKDPRNCLLLPFWRSGITPPDAAVFVYRDPIEVAGSIRARNKFPLTHGLALWERYVRAAAANLDGVPTLLVDFDRVLRDTDAWCGELIDFLDVVGIDADHGARERAVHSLDSALRHQQASPLPDDGVHHSQRQVLAVLGMMQGTHLPWSAPDLGVEPDWVEDVLAMRREFVALREQHRPSTSPVARVVGRLQRVTRGAKR
jgi:hypothetical protein